MHLWVVLLTSCGASLEGLVAEVPTENHLWDYRCNPLAFRDWGYLRHSVESLQDVELLSKGVERKVVAAEFGVVWVGGEEEAVHGLRDIWVTALAGFGDMFLNGYVLTKKKGDPWYTFTQFDVWSFYRHSFPQSDFILLRGVVNPTDLSASHTHLAFTTTSLTTSMHEIKLFDIWRKANVQIPTYTDHHVLKPSIVGSWLTYSTFDPITGWPAGWIHYVETGDTERLVHETTKLFGVQMWNASMSGGEAVITALSTPDNTTVTIQQTNSTVNLNVENITDTVDTEVFIFLMPSMTRCVVQPSQWQLDGFRYLRGVSGGGRWVFLAVSSEDETMFAVIAVDTTDCGETIFIIPESVTGRELDVVSGTGNGVIVALQGGDVAEHWLVSIYGRTAEGDLSLACKIFGGEEGGAVSGFQDVIVYEKDGGLFYYDLDKDNDYAYDVVDGLPVDHKFTNDSDNDGIGDEGDIVTNTRPCASHQRFSPTSCTSDLVILYSVWGVFTFFLIITCFCIGVYHKRHRETLYHEKKSYYDEWVNRQWRETTRENFTEEELFATMAELDDKIQRAHGLGGEVVVQSFLFLLTMLSVGLWVASMWSPTGFSVRTENIMAWVDFFTTTVFFVDLAYRWIFRDAGEYTDFTDYVVKNWYDFPSLISDIPGVTTAGTLGILVVARLVRVLRVLKMFRVVRLYHRVTQQQAVLGLILRYDNVWQAIFICGLILTVGVIIKLVEQDEQSVFGHYENVLWFCIVTVTTIGYGDMVPENPVSRILAVFLMVSGIGIIGVLTASMGDSVRFSGVDKDMMVSRMKKMQQGKWRLSLEYLRNSVLFNPILSIFKPYQRGICAHASCTKPSRILNNVDDVTKISYQDYKFHSSCFRCAGCGRSGSGLMEGPCWVVPHSVVTPKRKKKSSVGVEEEATSVDCNASIYLHTLCLRRARGDVRSDECDVPSEASSMETSMRNLYIRKEEIIVEELIVSGLTKGAVKLNGMYQRRPAVHDDSSPFYDHRREPAIITKEDTTWKMYLVVKSESDQVSDVCFASSDHLLGIWDSDEMCEGHPMVEDACAQLHYWHRPYDPLDVPVRALMGNYASARTKEQFTTLLDNMKSTTAAGGKFSSVDRENVEQTTQMDRLRSQIKVVADLDEKRSYLRSQCDTGDKLTLILRTYRLDEPGKVKNYPLMKDHLEYLIFYKSAHHVHGTSLAKLFSISAALEEKEHKTDGKSEITNWGAWDEDEYDWNDTVEWTLNEMDRCLTEHEVDKLPVYTTVRIELEHLVLLYDRVLTCQWAWENLSWKKWEERAERPKRLTHNTTEMPGIVQERQQYASKTARALLDPLTDALERHQLEAGKKAASTLLTHNANEEYRRLSRSYVSANNRSDNRSVSSRANSLL